MSFFERPEQTPATRFPPHSGVRAEVEGITTFGISLQELREGDLRTGHKHKQPRQNTGIRPLRNLRTTSLSSVKNHVVVAVRIYEPKAAVRQTCIVHNEFVLVESEILLHEF